MPGLWTNFRCISQQSHDADIKNSGLFILGKWAKHRAYWHINNWGWNSSTDFSSTHNHKPLIAIIGDSYIEAFHVNLQKSMPAKIREMVGDKYEVYSFGVSGASLSDYLQMSRYANKYFKPDILVVNVVHNDFDESLCSVKRQEGLTCLECNDAHLQEVPVPYHPSKIKRFLRNSSLLRYLVINLQIMDLIHNTKYKANIRGFNANIDVEAVNRRRKKIGFAVDYVVSRIAQEFSGKKIIFMMDAPRPDIYGNHLNESSVIWMNQLIESECHKYAVNIIDLTYPFANDYRLHHHEFEFANDGHWNEYGHKIAAEALFQKLKEVAF